MRNINLKILVGLIIILWLIYFIQMFIERINKNKNKNEGFTSNINAFYRPYVRNANQYFETFVNNYGPNVIVNKLRKWNII